MDAGHRCLVPTWPLGAHAQPMHPDADLTPAGLAGLLEEFLEALDLKDVTLVGNDTGGALVQILMTRRPERVARIVLASCDVLDRFPPPPFGFLAPMSRLPGSLWLTAQLFRIRPLLRLPIGPILDAPEGLPKLVLALLSAGFFVVVILAWFYELTNEGIRSAGEVARDASLRPIGGRQLDFFIIGALLLATGYFAWESRFAGPDAAGGGGAPRANMYSATEILAPEASVMPSETWLRTTNVR